MPYEMQRDASSSGMNPQQMPSETQRDASSSGMNPQQMPSEMQREPSSSGMNPQQMPSEMQRDDSSIGMIPQQMPSERQRDSSSSGMNPQQMPSEMQRDACSSGMTPQKINPVMGNPHPMSSEMQRDACSSGMNTRQINTLVANPCRVLFEMQQDASSSGMQPQKSVPAIFDPHRITSEMQRDASSCRENRQQIKVTVDPHRLVIAQFARDLFNYLVCHNLGIYMSPPPPITERRIFTANIAKSIQSLWTIQRPVFQCHLQKESIGNLTHPPSLMTFMLKFSRKFFETGSEVSVFEQIKHNTAMLLEIIHALHERGIATDFLCVTECWVDIFEQFYMREFYARGGFIIFNEICH